MSRSIVSFLSTHHALRAEKALRARGIPITLIPLPRRIRTDCGICLAFSSDLEPRVRKILQEDGLQFEAFHRES